MQDDNNQKDITTEENVTLDDMLAEAVSEKTADAQEETSTTDEAEDAPKEDAPEENKTEEEAKIVEETIETPESDQPMVEEEKAETVDETEEPKDSSDEETTEDKKEEEAKTPANEAPARSAATAKGRWYIVHTYSGHENKVAKTLMQRVQSMGFENTIFDALVPTRETIRVRGGKKETVHEKIFPGYILVNMELSDEAWVLVRTTPGVTSFVGAQNKPTPIRDDEVNAIVAFIGQKEPTYKAQFSTGEAVKITDGPFSDFLGTVESIDEAKGKVKVLVSIFGRETPVELDFLQVSKI